MSAGSSSSSSGYAPLSELVSDDAFPKTPTRNLVLLGVLDLDRHLDFEVADSLRQASLVLGSEERSWASAPAAEAWRASGEARQVVVGRLDEIGDQIRRSVEAFVH